jgi:hypothetical protein
MISDNDDDDAFITESVIVPAGGFAVLCKNGDENANGGLACDYDFVSDTSPNDFYIANRDDELILSDDRTEIDRVEYDRGAGWPNAKGASMVYQDEPQADNNTPVAWTEATVREGRYTEEGSDLGSPGANGTGQVLPVELIAFDALQAGGAIQLTWKTSSETNNAGFHVERQELERQEPGRTGWTEIGFVKGAGTTTSEQQYAFTDDILPEGAASLTYRLRQVDVDGAAHYSPDVEVSLHLRSTFALQGNYPNPFTGSTVIQYQIPAEMPVRLDVYNIQGRRVAALVNEVQGAGTKTVTWSPENLASGIYVLRLEAEGRTRMQNVSLIR